MDLYSIVSFPLFNEMSLFQYISFLFLACFPHASTPSIPLYFISRSYVILLPEIVPPPSTAIDLGVYGYYNAK